MVKIIIIDENSPYLKEVIKLGDANRATLGQFPRGAFIEYATRKQILVALDENENLLGYLLFGINRKEILAYITHLCVNQSLRGKGVAKALVKKLKRITKDTFRGIRVRCRRDYEAGKLWPKLGFVARGERPGRAKEKTILTIWWLDFNYPTLFTFADEQRAQSKLKVAIDANVFYELQEPPTSANEESHALLADWLEEVVELCLTNEIFNEIDRNPDEAERERQWWIFAEKFMILRGPDDEFQKVSEELHDFFPQRMSVSDESDLRQLARSIVADAKFFVTRDEKLLKKAEQIYKNFEMHIMRPYDLIIHQDSLIREAEYRPTRLAGSRIEAERIHSEQGSLLENTFRSSHGETKTEFKQRFQPYLADPHTFQADIIRDKGQPLALIIYGRQKQHELEIPVFRVVRNRLSAILARHMVFQTVLISSGEKRLITKITEPRLSDDVIDALRESGFVFINNAWIKVNLPVVEKAEDLALRLTSLTKDFSQITEYFQEMADILKTAYSTNNINMLLKIERALSPAKIMDMAIPSFIVTIRPEWAMNLFDSEISNQDLFGGKPSLMFNIENVYYRSVRQKVLSAPGRILWHVLKGNYQGTMSIRACSYLDEVIIDKPKALFSRFQGLGVYEWKDVFEISGQNTDQEIMVLRFSNTELFSNPIQLDDLRKIWLKETGKSINPQSPIYIPNERFFHLYKMGTSSLEKG